jgi:hypothetical protein
MQFTPEEQARREAAEKAFEERAQDIATRFDSDGLTYQVNRWSFGSLSHQYNAAQMRRLYWRAFEIAVARETAQPVLIAAE